VNLLISWFHYWLGKEEKKQLSVTDASRLVYDLLDPIFSVKPEDNKYVTYLEEKISSEVGSQGNLKSEGSTLADFIVAPKKQQKKKKKTKKVTQEENEEKKEVPIPQEQPKTLIVSKEEQNVESDKFDPIYNPATISKSIPYGWQFGVLTKNLLKKKSLLKEMLNWVDMNITLLVSVKKLTMPLLFGIIQM